MEYFRQQIKNQSKPGISSMSTNKTSYDSMPSKKGQKGSGVKEEPQMVIEEMDGVNDSMDDFPQYNKGRS